MIYWMTTAAFFAQKAEDAPAADAEQQNPYWWLPLVAIGVLFYFMMIRPQKREQSKRQSLLDSLKKNDKVVTIGGIIGTIAAISPDSDEVTVKVDENTRMRFRRSSIQQVVTAETEAEKS
ncbi:preprotein translocase subunit YajC [Symmachiella macrocystis]|uniref:Sec translocon accessory complex subunit YajC n=1 Tax=Symmachiella macrocystis TaxID=2527985 RepID=A0A5C6BL56_9PLAN|nr:preprotein translocase subunit YajC [Symmachiella macrocystis]TWU12820.1 preprotein translocase subunit YajC [Symmachiella macrocystis]